MLEHSLMTFPESVGAQLTQIINILIYNLLLFPLLINYSNRVHASVKNVHGGQKYLLMHVSAVWHTVETLLWRTI